MKSNFVNITFIVLLFSFIGYAQAPQIQWQKSLGGTNIEYANSIIQTSDGGYIVAGSSTSNNGDVTGHHGSTPYDYWVVKLSSTGVIEWQKSLRGTHQDMASSIIQTTDGGYIVSGSTLSPNDGDVTGNHGNYDYWIVKLSSTGTIEWQKCLGGTSDEMASSIKQTIDGGFIVAGYSQSNNGDVTGNLGYDAWVVKLSSTGVIQWQKCIGGTNVDNANSITQTTDGGYIFCGGTLTGAIPGGGYVFDAWVVKLSSTGVIEWQKFLGGTGSESLRSIIQTTDGGYIAAGGSNSNNGDVSGNHGDRDYWVVKLSSTGVIQWQKCLGGTDSDYASSIIQTIDGGYIVSGDTPSYDGDVSGNHGSYDYWIVKLSSTGTIEWQKCLGGTGGESSINSIIQASDGGYVIAGSSNSTNGDVTGNHGDKDSWIVKLSGNLTTSSFLQETTITLFPNPAKENVFIKLDYFSPSQEITITDIQGKIIYTQKLESLSTTINTSSFSKGIYFLNVIDGTQKTTKKFMIE
jgi:hypothetical protein